MPLPFCNKSHFLSIYLFISIKRAIDLSLSYLSQNVHINLSVSLSISVCTFLTIYVSIYMSHKYIYIERDRQTDRQTEGRQRQRKRFDDCSKGSNDDWYHSQCHSSQNFRAFHIPSFSSSFIFNSWPASTISTIWTGFYFYILTISLFFRPGLGDMFVFQRPWVFYGFPFLAKILACRFIICQRLISYTIRCWLPFLPSHAYLGILCATLSHSLTMWLLVLSPSVHNLQCINNFYFVIISPHGIIFCYY